MDDHPMYCKNGEVGLYQRKKTQACGHTTSIYWLDDLYEWNDPARPKGGRWLTRCDKHPRNQRVSQTAADAQSAAVRCYAWCAACKRERTKHWKEQEKQYAAWKAKHPHPLVGMEE